MHVVTGNHPGMLDAVVVRGAAQAPHLLLTGVSPTPQPGTAETQIPALGHSRDSSCIHGNANIVIVALGFEAVIKIHFQ